MNKICEKIAFKIVESEAETGTYGNIDITVDKDHNLEDFIGAPVYESKRFYDAETTPPGVVTGLAYNSHGGSILYIEATKSSFSEGGGSG
jgi:ATP-dependent Lon protease